MAQPIIVTLPHRLGKAEALRGRPMTHRKASQAGKDERRAALGPAFSDLDLIERNGGAVGLDVEDILDAAAACWSAGPTSCWPRSQPAGDCSTRQHGVADGDLVVT